MKLELTSIARLLAFILLAAVPAYAAKQYDQEVVYPIPEIKQDCSTCHFDAGAHGRGVLKKQLPELCLDCHPKQIPPKEHVIGTAPSETNIHLPLVDGKITCITCHDPHQNRFGTLLRMKATELCLICHKR